MAGSTHLLEYVLATVAGFLLENPALQEKQANLAEYFDIGSQNVLQGNAEALTLKGLGSGGEAGFSAKSKSKAGKIKKEEGEDRSYRGTMPPPENALSQMGASFEEEGTQPLWSLPDESEEKDFSPRRKRSKTPHLKNENRPSLAAPEMRETPKGSHSVRHASSSSSGGGGRKSHTPSEVDLAKMADEWAEHQKIKAEDNGAQEGKEALQQEEDFEAKKKEGERPLPLPALPLQGGREDDL